MRREYGKKGQKRLQLLRFRQREFSENINVIRYDGIFDIDYSPPDKKIILRSRLMRITKRDPKTKDILKHIFQYVDQNDTHQGSLESRSVPNKVQPYWMTNELIYHFFARRRKTKT